ncbi:MAG: 3-phosphoshikimate 1-carboxyvinyltransferase [Succinivibrionaceae bacterium]
MEQLKLKKRDRACGIVNLPGSKSVSNRVLLLSALAKGTTEIRNLLNSDDTSRMLEALKEIGIRYELSEDKTKCVIHGNAGKFECLGSLNLFLGNAGTAMRPLTAVLCGCKGEFVLTGEPRMEERPIGHLTDALISVGAKIEFLKKEGYPPLKIKGTDLRGGDVEIDGTVSSQFLTAFLMAAPLATEDTVIHIKGELVSKPYIDITIGLMQKYGVVVENDNYKSFKVKGGQCYISPKEFLVEGDASGASYFLAAAAIAGKVRVTGVGINSVQGDVKFTKVLVEMGAKLTIGDDYIECEKNTLHGVDLDLNAIPDAAMTVVPLALFAKGKTVIRNVANWRVKETDRLHAMAVELQKLGIECIEGEDYLEIIPGKIKKGVAIDTYNDHRMAMCFSLVSFATDVIINDPRCCSKTFPDYFDKFDSICNKHK